MNMHPLRSGDVNFNQMRRILNLLVDKSHVLDRLLEVWEGKYVEWFVDMTRNVLLYLKSSYRYRSGIIVRPVYRGGFIQYIEYTVPW